VGNFIEVVVYNLTKIHEGIFLNLNFSGLVDLDSGGMNNTQITDKVLSILANNHKLGLPKLFVVGDLVVVGLTLTDLEDTHVTIEADGEVLDFFGVNSLKVEVQFISGSLVGWAVERLSLEVDVHFNVGIRQLTEGDGVKILVVCEAG
jgi:hypothetical protein